MPIERRCWPSEARRAGARFPSSERKAGCLKRVGGGLGFRTGRAVQFPGVPHNRLLVSLAHALGHETLTSFGNPDYCGASPLAGLT